MHASRSLIGVILAGGKSERFGSDKAVMPFGTDQRPLLLHLSDQMSDLGLTHFVSVRETGRYQEFGLKELADRFVGCGPISGVATALTTLKAGRFLFLTCDMPLVGKKVLEELILSSEHGANCAFVFENEIEPFPCVLQKNVWSLIEGQIAKKEYAMKMFFDICPDVKKIPLDEKDFFANMNTRHDYELLYVDPRRLQKNF